jgi:cytochrome c-type biogenesis protein CcmH/NrfF
MVRTAMSFALGFVLVLLVAAAISVYAFGQFERLKGPHTTFMIFAWIAPVWAAVLGLVFALGARALRRSPSPWISAAIGAAGALAFYLAPYLLR